MREIPLSGGRAVALIDDRDFVRVTNAGPWYLLNIRRGAAHLRYAYKNVMGRTVLMHRFILRGVRESEGRNVDHVNGDGLDNRRTNLRVATRAENARNRRAGRSSTSRFLGVSRHLVSGKWRAAIGGEHLGLFDDEVDAALAYDREAQQRYGRFARLNLPWLRGEAPKSA